jgi:hypothetical protein
MARKRELIEPKDDTRYIRRDEKGCIKPTGLPMLRSRNGSLAVRSWCWGQQRTE